MVSARAPPAEVAAKENRGRDRDDAHMHVLGEIVGATGFGGRCAQKSQLPTPLQPGVCVCVCCWRRTTGTPSKRRSVKPPRTVTQPSREPSCTGGTNARNVFCEWKLVLDSGWTLVQGCDHGCTHMAAPLDDSDMSVLSHPIQLLLKTQSVQGWPKLVVKVFEHHDYVGSNTFLAYGICSIPTTPGTHMLQCTTWRANDRMTWLKDELSGFFTNRTTELKNEDFVQLRKEAYTAAVVTVGMGVLHLKLALLKEGAAWESLHTASASMRRSSEMGQRMRDPQKQAEAAAQGRMASRTKGESDDDDEAAVGGEALDSVMHARGARLRRATNDANTARRARRDEGDEDSRRPLSARPSSAVSSRRAARRERLV